MGITGLIPFLDKASRRANVKEFSGCTVAIDSYCWLHKGAFACAERLVRGEDTDIHIKYCLKYVTMLLSYNIKPILVFDGRHLPAKAMTEAKRRESRDTSKKRAAELLSLGKTEEARSYMRRSVDITHKMALDLIRECRRRNVDCIVAPYEADAQLAYLNVNNYAHLVITEDSDLILFGCNKVLFKMDLDGTGTLVETCKLPLVMRCPIERYTFDKFRQMCIMSGCDYLASLPGIGLAKARQFVTATQDSHFANALKKLPSFFNKSSLVVTDEYREGFLKAEATFKHQYVYDPVQRCMRRLTDVDDEDIEKALCVNAGELLDEKIAFQLALGNVDPFTLRKMDDWDPDNRTDNKLKTKSDSWTEKPASHPSIWSSEFKKYLSEAQPWAKKPRKAELIIAIPQTRVKKKVVNLVSKYVAETQDESLTIETLSSMYCVEPMTKKLKICDNDNFTQNSECSQDQHNIALNDDEINKELTQREKSPILETKDRSFVKYINESHIMKRLSRFPRTTIGENLVESKFFSATSTSSDIEENSINPFKIKEKVPLEIDSQCFEIPDSQLENSQKENDDCNSPIKKAKNCLNKSILESLDKFRNTVNNSEENDSNENVLEGEKSPILEPSRKSKNPFRLKAEEFQRLDDSLSENSVVENTYPMEGLVTPVDSQASFGDSPPSNENKQVNKNIISQPNTGNNIVKKNRCRVPGLKRTSSLPSNQPTLLSKFGFQKKPVLKRLS